MNGGELVGGPDGDDDEEDEAGEVDGAASAQAGVTPDEDHEAVGEPHGEGEKDLGIVEVGGADGLFGEGGADEQAGGHAGEAKEEGLEGHLVDGLERRQAGECRLLRLETVLLDEIEDGGEQREEEGGVGGEQQGDVQEDPDAAVERETGCLFARPECGDESEEKDDGQDEDTEREGAVDPVDDDEGDGEDEANEDLEFVGIDRQAVVGGVQHLGE